MAYVKETLVDGGENTIKTSNENNNNDTTAAEDANKRKMEIAIVKDQIRIVETELAELIILKTKYEDLKKGIDNIFSILSTSSSSLENTIGQLKAAYTGFKANTLKITVANASAEITGITGTLNSIKQNASQKINELKIKIENKEKELNALNSKLACL